MRSILRDRLAVAEIFLGSHFGVRGDIRYVHAFQDLTVQGFTLSNTKLNYGRASGGLVLKF